MKDKLYQESQQVIDSMLISSEHIHAADYDMTKTVVLVVDMINGFAKEGALYSKRVENIIESNKKVLEQFSCDHVFLCDYHEPQAREFDVFLPHCQIGSDEVAVVDALKAYADKGRVIRKNSTNGFLEPEFQNWLKNKTIETWLIIGCCTDLCVMQLALSLKAHYNRLNSYSEIIVIENAVETYDVKAIHHPGDFMHLMAMKMMKDNGILLRRI